MKIVVCSPVPFGPGNESGIHIRLKGIVKYLRDNGHTVRIIDQYRQNAIMRFEFVYCLVSTKKDSITYEVIQNLNRKNIKIITDLYTPILLEKDTTYSSSNLLEYLTRRKQISIIQKILSASTYFVVANSRQKDYWLTTSKKLHQPIKSQFISTIPTGYPSTIDFTRKPENVIAWFGGIYPWLDPAPLINSFASLAPSFPSWRLRIIGGYYPSTGYQKIFKIFSNELKNISSNQIENIPWQKPFKLLRYLKDISFAVHLPKITMEDYYAHRIRLLTLMNYNIPVATSGRDLISKLIIDIHAGWKISNNGIKLQNQLSDLMKNSNSISKMSANTSKVQLKFLNNELSDKIFNK